MTAMTKAIPTAQDVTMRPVFEFLSLVLSKSLFSWSHPMVLAAVAFSYLLINLMCISMFWHDKRAAVSKRQRLPERQLLWIAFLGGSLGALLASRLFRHKLHKQPFRTRLLAIAGFHCACLVALAWLILTGQTVFA